MKRLFSNHSTSPIAALALFAASVAAQPVGTAFTYQGRLSDRGVPANGQYDFTFTLYNAASAGTAVSSPVATNAVAVSNGLFTVSLDFGSAFDGSALWLEIAVRTNGPGSFISLAPRPALTASPYALYALSAGSLGAGGLPPGVVTNGEVGVNLTGTFTGNGAGLTGVAGSLPGVTTSNWVRYGATNTLIVSGAGTPAANGVYRYSDVLGRYTNSTPGTAIVLDLNLGPAWGLTNGAGEYIYETGGTTGPGNITWSIGDTGVAPPPAVTYGEVTNLVTVGIFAGQFPVDESRLAATNGLADSPTFVFPGAIGNISVGPHPLDPSQKRYTMLRFGPETTNNWIGSFSGLVWARGDTQPGGAQIMNWATHCGCDPNGGDDELVISSSGKIALGTGLRPGSSARGLQIGIGRDTYMYLQGAENVTDAGHPSCALLAAANDGTKWVGHGAGDWTQPQGGLPGFQLYPIGHAGAGEWRFYDYLITGASKFDYANSRIRARLGVGPDDTNGFFAVNGTISATNGVASYRSNTTAVAAIALTAATTYWTNSGEANAFVFVNGADVTAVALGPTNLAQTTIFTAAPATVPLQPGWYVGVTTNGTGAATVYWRPF